MTLEHDQLYSAKVSRERAKKNPPNTMTEEAKARTTTFLICMFAIVIELSEIVVVVLSRSI